MSEFRDLGEVVRSRFGWLGKLNAILYWVGLVVVWEIEVTDAPPIQYKRTVGYRLTTVRKYNDQFK